MSERLEGRIEMKRMLRESGISSADLHNWVKRGLLPRSCGRVNGEGPGSTYFYPAWALERASDIRRLRLLGMSMQNVRKVLRGEKVELGRTYRQLRYERQKLQRGEAVRL